MGVIVRNSPKVGVVVPKVGVVRKISHVDSIFYFVPVSSLINLATMHTAVSSKAWLTVQYTSQCSSIMLGLLPLPSHKETVKKYTITITLG